MDVALEFLNYNIDIFTDSLSLVQALNNPRNKININFPILEIRKKYLIFMRRCDNKSTVIIY